MYVQFSLLFGLQNPGAGDPASEGGTDACRKFWIKPLKETDLGVAQDFLTPNRDHVKTQTNENQWLLIMAKTLSSNTFTHK